MEVSMDQIGGRFFGYFGKILILSGMVLVFGSVGVLISHFLAKLFFGVDLSVISFQSIKKDDLQIIAALKLYQTIGGGIGMFLIPAFIFPAAVNYRIRVFPFHQQQVSVLPFMIGVFSILIVAPAISWLYQINQQMHFPAAWQAWETSIKEMEDQAAMLTKLFVAADSYSMLLLNIFVVALVPAICEEFFFRGILLQYTRFVFTKKWIAVLVSALVFSGFHGQFYGFLPRFALGVLLGYLFLFSGNLVLPIVAHFINNAIAVLLVFYEKELSVYAIFSSTYEFAWYWAVLSAALGIMALLMLKNSANKHGLTDIEIE